MTVGTDVEGAVLTIVTCARAPKALSEHGGGTMTDGDIKEMRGCRNNRAIVSELYNKRAIGIHSILVEVVFGVNGSEGRRCVGRDRR